MAATTEVTSSTLPGLVSALADRDPLFASLAERNGTPPEWRRVGSFATLVLFILEQQVSLASARAAYLRLCDTIGEVTPTGFLTLDDVTLRSVGFSRQKTGYVRGLADLLETGSLDLDTLGDLDDDAATERLLTIRGVGRWTAACYLLFVLGRPDVWPTGDRALYVAMRDALSLDDVPPAEIADGMADSWSPYRSVAARMLWHDYLGGRDWQPSPALPGVG